MGQRELEKFSNRYAQYLVFPISDMPILGSLADRISTVEELSSYYDGQLADSNVHQNVTLYQKGLSRDNVNI